MQRCIFVRVIPKNLHQDAGTARGKIYGSGVEKATPGGIENTGFFRGVGEGARYLYLLPRKWG